MKSFEYTIKDELGIHARPAGMLAKKAKEFESEILLSSDDTTVNATKLISVMGMGIKCGDRITVTVNGKDEERAESEMKAFFENNL
ncbi:MAG: HPr family phosphocarrier protein [Oscillospiraceae bacterium]|nr:HPr family phosphocarrier protein [Oscillospiraceae bacterium]